MSERLINFLIVLWVILLVAAIGVCIGISIYCHIEYGNLPVTEVPSWAIPWIIGSGK